MYKVYAGYGGYQSIQYIYVYITEFENVFFGKGKYFGKIKYFVRMGFIIFI